MKILGIDPGLSGAIACLDTTTGGLVVHDIPVHQVKTSTRKLQNNINAGALAELIRGFEPDWCGLEKVNAMPGQGVVSMFRFGQAYGITYGIVSALNIPVVHVTPQAWQKAVRLPKGEGASNIRASEIFPRYASVFARKKDHGRADAALICHFLNVELDAFS